MTRDSIAGLIAGAFTAAVMSGAVSAAMLVSNEGFVPGLFVRWLGSWSIGFAIALPVGIVVSPLSDRLRQRIRAGRAR